jgi:hypothetical protein
VSRTVVRGRLLDTAGNPLNATVTFTPEPTRIVVRVDDTTLYNVSVVAQTDPATGEFSLEVLSSDDPDLDPTDWTYRVRIVANGVDDTIVGVRAPAGAPVDPNTGKPTVELTDQVGGTASPGVGVPYLLANLGDVDVITRPPADGQPLVWEAATERWVPGDRVVTLFKTEDTARADTATPTPDPHLSGASLPAGRYIFDGLIIVSATTTTPGLALRIYNDVDQNTRWSAGNHRDPASGNLVPVELVQGNTTLATGTSATGPTGLHVHGTFVNVVTRALLVEWAQNTASPDATTVHEGSFIRVTRIA